MMLIYVLPSYYYLIWLLQLDFEKKIFNWKLATQNHFFIIKTKLDFFLRKTFLQVLKRHKMAITYIKAHDCSYNRKKLKAKIAICEYLYDFWPVPNGKLPNDIFFVFILHST